MYFQVNPPLTYSTLTKVDRRSPVHALQPDARRKTKTTEERRHAKHHP